MEQSILLVVRIRTTRGILGPSAILWKRDRMHNTELTPDRLSVIAYTLSFSTEYGPWYGPYVTSNDWAWLHSGRDCLFPQPLFSSGYSFRWSLVLPCYHVVNPFIPSTLFAFEVATGSPVLELLS
ncbi:hypothetical protein KY289_031405 [Solanum tuberosum]|nr:hypothetical protein KY289_031405 [Solanum tuberosum]